ncbi:MAG: tubulin-like doman-containing protein, partial [Myxococcota bacterium]|nr:tubulin-like doman-containing protein [Myxococcota bacterium]
YPPSILIGLGGTGTKALEHLRRMLYERFSRAVLPGMAFLSIDTDQSSKDGAAEDKNTVSPMDRHILFKDHERLELSKGNVGHYLGENLSQYPHIQEWWDNSIQSLQGLNSKEGAGQVRPLSRILTVINYDEIVSKITAAKTQVKGINVDSARVQASSDIDVYIIAGLAGGTGSGMFLDTAAIVKSTLNNCKIRGYFVLPSAYKSIESKYAKLAANGVAALRELNHYMNNPFEVQWKAGGKKHSYGSLYEYCYLLAGENHNGKQIGTPTNSYIAIGESLFLRFSGGKMPGFIQSVQVNRWQYLNNSVNYEYRGKNRERYLADSWKTKFSSLGISKLVFPSWRLLHYARYDLAAELLQLINPDSKYARNFRDSVTSYRNEFLIELNLFQGTYVEQEDGQMKTTKMNQTRDRLAQLAGENSGNIFQKIENRAEMMVEDAESMLLEKSTIADCRGAWQQLSAKFGRPEAPGQAGDWALVIEANAKSLVQEIANAIPSVIEDFYSRLQRGEVGITGLAQILQSCKDIMNHSISEEANIMQEEFRYINFMRKYKTTLKNRMDENEAEFERQIENADKISKPLLFSPDKDNHRESVQEASRYMKAYWRAKITHYICDHCIKVFETAVSEFDEMLLKVEYTLRKLKDLQSQFFEDKNHFKASVKASMFKELGTTISYDTLLEYYLGKDADKKEERLKRILDRFLRHNNYTTFASLHQAVSDGDSFSTFEVELSAETFFALKGNDSHYTSAFGDETEKPKEGFVLRHSAARAIKQLSSSQLKEMLKFVYDKGLPWIQKCGSHIPASNYSEAKDAFIGYVGDSDTVELLSNAMLEIKEDFEPRRVMISDPSEIVFYTETHGFPVYHSNDLHDSGGMIEHYITHLKNRLPLHIHREFESFQTLVPKKVSEMDLRRRNYQVFIEAQILGLLKTIGGNGVDERKSFFVKQVVTPDGREQWPAVGTEIAYLEKLFHNAHERNKLNEMLSEKRKAFLDNGGTWGQLYVIAYYWLQALYPALRDEERKAQEKTDASVIVAKLETQALEELMETYREKADRNGEPIDAASRDLLRLRKTHFQNFSSWTVPISLNKGDPIPIRSEPEQNNRKEKWEEMSLVVDQVQLFSRRGWLERVQETAFDSQVQFPRLAINWERYEPQYYDYKHPNMHHVSVEFEMLDVVSLYAEKPTPGQHLVRLSGADEWKDIFDFPDIAKALRDKGFERPENLVKAASEPISTEDVSATDDPMVWYFSPERQKSQFKASEVAQRVLSSPGNHRVYHLDTWLSAEEHPAVQRYIQQSSGPPSPTDEPAPPEPQDALSGELHYYSERHGTEEDVSVETVIERILSESGEHYIIKAGLHKDWISWNQFQPLAEAVAKAKTKKDTLPPPPGRRLPPPPKS